MSKTAPVVNLTDSAVITHTFSDGSDGFPSQELPQQTGRVDGETRAKANLGLL